MTRKQFLLGGGVVAGGAVAGWFGVGLIEYMGAGPETPWRALAEDEAMELDRIVEELIPADPPAPWNDMKGFPGAHDAKVARFIDWQLAEGGAPYEGHLPCYREHLALVKGLSAEEIEGKYPDFFELVLRHARQGFYGHPRHGGNAQWASYRMLGIAAPTPTGRNIPGKENHL